MRTKSEPFPAGSIWAMDDAAAVVRRVWYATPVVGGVFAVTAAFAAGWRDAVGVVLGVGLAMVNFRALQNSLRGILDSGRERAPSGTTMMFVLRWIVVATAAFAAYRSDLASLVGIFAGLFAPAMAIGLEAVFQVVQTLRNASTDAR